MKQAELESSSVSTAVKAFFMIIYKIQ